jgi:transglutaminase-like putative cysteine protease
MKKLISILFTLLVILTPLSVYAASYDFHIESNMSIKYENGNDYVTVQLEYIREVINDQYYFSTDGNKTFPIPDISYHSTEQIKTERDFKKNSLTVTDANGKKVNYSIETKDDGLYVVVPNYKQTTKASPYKLLITYNTHDYIQVVNQNIVIQAPSLPKDTQFEITDENTKTKTELEYNLDILVDKNSPVLAKIWPESYQKEDIKGFNKYIFTAQSRLGQNPYIELGTSQIYRFELEYITPKTDNVIPEKYSDVFNSISTNIYEISLPRHFDETNQTVKIDTISPTPTKLERDSEGNIIATFEVPANKEGKISIIGYAWLEQQPYDSKREIPNPTIENYVTQIQSDEKLKSYLTETKYWQVNDPYIQDEAKKIQKDETRLLDLIKADYRYINEHLEYDQTKADTINDRIGAKQALQGDSAVCMEYADAMISILRAQGIAARAAIGYANLKEADETNESQVRHQWVEVWIPDYGWLSIDPTWESENMDIGQNIHKLLWETFNGNDLSNTRIYSADSLDDINDIQFNISIYGVKESEIENLDKLQNYEEIVPIKDQENSNQIGDWFNKFIKASSIGRSLAIVIPVLLTVVFLILIVGITKVVIKRIKANKKEDLPTN